MTRKEMLARPDRDEWQAAERAEIKSLIALDCWTRVPRSHATKKPLNCGFVYKQKPAAPPLPPRKKARLCIKGWNEDVSDLETFAPVVRFETVRTALNHAAHEDLELLSADVCSAYILSPLQPGQEVFMNDNVRITSRSSVVISRRRRTHTWRQREEWQGTSTIIGDLASSSIGHRTSYLGSVTVISAIASIRDARLVGFCASSSWESICWYKLSLASISLVSFTSFLSCSIEVS